MALRLPAVGQQAVALRRDGAFLRQLRPLPRSVAAFQWRARRLALRTNDDALVSSTRPRKLATLLEVSNRRERVVELGTAAGWTAICLALDDPTRRIVTYDVGRHPMLDRYLALVSPEVRARIEFVCAPGDEGPRGDDAVDLLYIDTAHEKASTVSELDAWRPVLRPGAVVVFDDVTHPEYPGVRDAIAELGLQGDVRDGLFVHHVT
jgi:predicted O-methyltransferase YrrM